MPDYTIITGDVDDLGAALECPARGGGHAKNEFGQDCRECLKENLPRAAICDAIEEGLNPELDPLLTVSVRLENDFAVRVLRRAGLEDDEPEDGVFATGNLFGYRL